LPRAAWNVGDGRFSAELSAFPVRWRYIGIEDILQEPKPLSVRATRGFARRLAESGLKTAGWFPAVLQLHLKTQEAAWRRLRRLPRA
jgi:hypothetical protein